MAHSQHIGLYACLFASSLTSAIAPAFASASDLDLRTHVSAHDLRTHVSGHAHDLQSNDDVDVGVVGHSARKMMGRADIQRQVEQYVSAAVTQRFPTGQVTVKALPLTTAIDNKPCDDVQIQAPGQRLHGRVSVHVRCNAPATWALYAQVEVDLQLPVVVATGMIARGERVTAAMLDVQMRPAAEVRSQAVTRIADALDKAAVRSLRSGQVISANHLTVPDAVRKGERVRILSASGRVQIFTHGIAMENGKLGEQIKVQNERSKRLIYPWVTGSGTVSTRAKQVISSAGR